MIKLISIIIPVYNEEEVLPELFLRLFALKEHYYTDIDFEFIFINDGSTDGTIEILKKQANGNKIVKIISFSRNFGHQMAITAGIENAIGDYVAIIDADLQDPPELIPKMYEMAISQDLEVVYGKRRKRTGETFLKKSTAHVFYRIMNYMADINIPYDTGDFRIMTRKVVEDFKKMPEQHRFIRGMIPWLGYKSSPFEYDRNSRNFGETKYPFKKMFSFAVNGVFSFSKKPLMLATRFGLLLIFAGIMLAVYMLYLKLFTNVPVAGITSIILLIVFFSGFQILLIGIVGEYLGRIFDEVKKRPLFIIDEKINC
jgi:polyisoprenyl-phosphate glycosyltransferase